MEVHNRMRNASASESLFIAFTHGNPHTTRLHHDRSRKPCGLCAPLAHKHTVTHLRLGLQGRFPSPANVGFFSFWTRGERVRVVL